MGRIRMEEPYLAGAHPLLVWRENITATAASTVEQGDNEQIPTLESLRKFIPERQTLADL